jgi:hypothetical protein
MILMTLKKHNVSDVRDKVQEKTFTRWVQIQLKKKGENIVDLSKDFKDGIKLIKLYESLSEKFKINKKR